MLLHIILLLELRDTIQVDKQIWTFNQNKFWNISTRRAILNVFLVEKNYVLKHLDEGQQ